MSRTQTQMRGSNLDLIQTVDVVSNNGVEGMPSASLTICPETLSPAPRHFHFDELAIVDNGDRNHSAFDIYRNICTA